MTAGKHRAGCALVIDVRARRASSTAAAALRLS